MKKKSMVVGQDLTPDWVKKIGTKLAEIFRQLSLGLKEPGKGLSLEQVQAFIEHRNPFVKVTTRIVDAYEHIRRDWEKFYKDNFSLSVDFSGVRIPNCPGIGWRLLFIIQGLGPELVYQVSRQAFGKAWKYHNQSLDVVVTENERSNKDGSYAIWVRDGQEADAIHKNKPAEQVERERFSTETCLERLIHGLKFYRETGKHLDVETVTLCSGSRYSDGGVPDVGWNGFRGGLGVGWCSPGAAVGVLRPREVVS